jgi:hypothetical protein
MAAYSEIAKYVYKTHGISIKTRHIADVKRTFGLTSRVAPNRHDQNSVKHPCPNEKRKPIEDALKHFHMI